MTPETTVLAAVVALVLLTFVLLVWLGFQRLPLVAAGSVRPADIALSRESWPDRAQQAANAFDNQFQLPVLAYVAAGISIYLGASWPEAALLWTFVASRCLHAWIHVTSNHVFHRFQAYMLGMGVLAALWAMLAGRIVLRGFAG